MSFKTMDSNKCVNDGNKEKKHLKDKWTFIFMPFIGKENWKRKFTDFKSCTVLMRIYFLMISATLCYLNIYYTKYT